MATGTGKTFVSLQSVWKLWSSKWRSGRKPRVLYLADRNILVDQPIEREYVPAFGEGPIWKLRGEAKAGREIYFGLYQSLVGLADDPDAMYRQFDRTSPTTSSARIAWARPSSSASTANTPTRCVVRSTTPTATSPSNTRTTSCGSCRTRATSAEDTSATWQTPRRNTRSSLRPLSCSPRASTFRPSATLSG